MQNTWVQDIAEMHKKFGVNEVIRNLSPENLRAFLKFRVDFLKEELTEMVEASENPNYKKPESRADDIVDALIDLCVVAIGTLDALDIDAETAWKRVHTKNMEKEVGIKAGRPNPLGLPDLVKPENWEAPTHADNIGLLSKIF